MEPKAITFYLSVKKNQMKEQDFNSINEAYFKLILQQKLVSEDLDYSVLEHYRLTLQQLADISNSGISVYDTYKKEHAFHSSNLGLILGYTTQDIESEGEYFLDTKIHPEDFEMLLKNGLSIFKFFINFSTEEKLNHKLVSEYRILNHAGNYVRVIEQQQVLELDKKGNLWLTLSILDISPNQKNMHEGLKSELMNFRTGKTIPFFGTKEEITTTLTKREIEVLKLVKEGLISKEISDKLSISLHTVNTYRQRFLEKLGVSNSLEAVRLASNLGLI